MTFNSLTTVRPPSSSSLSFSSSPAIRRMFSITSAKVFLLIIVVHCSVNAAEAVVGVSSPTDAASLVGEVQRSIIDVRRGMHGSKASEVHCVGCQFGQCAVSCLATDKCAGFDFLIDSGTCYMHSVQTVCLPLFERQGASHYRRVKCGNDTGNETLPLPSSTSPQPASTTSFEYSTTTARTTGNNSTTTDAVVNTTSTTTTVNSTRDDRTTVSVGSTGSTNASSESVLSALTSKLLSLLSSGSASEVLSTTSSLPNVTTTAAAATTTTTTTTKTIASTSSNVSSTRVTQPMATSPNASVGTTRAVTSSPLSTTPTAPVTKSGASSGAVPAANKSATHLDAIPAITSSGVHRLNVLTSIAKATRDSMSLGTFAELARSLLSDVPTETVNSLILNKHKLDLLGNSAGNTTESAAAAAAIAEAWTVGLAKQNTTGGGTTIASTLATNVTVSGSPGSRTSTQKIPDDGAKKSIAEGELNIETLLETETGKNSSKEGVPTNTLQSLAAFFRSSLSTESVPAVVTTTPTPAVAITPTTASVAPLVSGSYFAMNNEAIADLVANILLNKQQTPSTSSTVPPQSSTQSTSAAGTSTKTTKTSHTPKHKLRTTQPSLGQSRTAATSSQRVSSSTTTLPTTSTAPTDDEYHSNELKLNEGNYDYNYKSDGDDEQSPPTIAQVTTTTAAAAMTTTTPVTSRPKTGSRLRTSPMPFLNNVKPKFETSPVSVGHPATAPQTRLETTGGRRKVVREGKGRVNGQVAKSGDILGNNLPTFPQSEATASASAATLIPAAIGYEPFNEPTKTVIQPATWQQVWGTRSEGASVTPTLTSDPLAAYRPVDLGVDGSVLGGPGVVSVPPAPRSVPVFPIPTKMPRGWVANPDRRIGGSAYVMKNVGGGDRCVEECALGKRTCLAVDYDTRKDECWVYDSPSQACGALINDLYFYHVKALRCAVSNIGGSSSSNSISRT